MKKYKDFFFDLDNTLYDTKSLVAGTPVEGAIELIRFLRDVGCRLHICSNGRWRSRMEKIWSLHLEDAFETVVCSEMAGVEKPDKYFFDYALQLTEAQAETTLMIGDNYDTDIIGATAAGIDTVLFNRWEADWVPPGPVTYRVNELKEIIELWQK